MSWEAPNVKRPAECQAGRRLRARSLGARLGAVCRQVARLRPLLMAPQPRKVSGKAADVQGAWVGSGHLRAQLTTWEAHVKYGIVLQVIKESD